MLCDRYRHSNNVANCSTTITNVDTSDASKVKYWPETVTSGFTWPKITSEIVILALPIKKIKK